MPEAKLLLAIALISRAECIVLDEPTAGVDPRARRELCDILHAIRSRSNCSIVLTSHSMEECEALCTRIGILRRGELIALGTSQAIKFQYGNTFMITLVMYGLVDRKSVCEKIPKAMPDAILKTPDTSLSMLLVWEVPKKRDDKWSTKYAEVEVVAKRDDKWETTFSRRPFSRTRSSG